MGPTLKKRIKRKEDVRWKETEEENGRRIFFIFLFILFASFSDLRKSDRRDKHEKCFTRRGLRVSTKNTGFH